MFSIFIMIKSEVRFGLHAVLGHSRLLQSTWTLGIDLPRVNVGCSSWTHLVLQNPLPFSPFEPCWTTPFEHDFLPVLSWCPEGTNSSNEVHPSTPCIPYLPALGWFQRSISACIPIPAVAFGYCDSSFTRWSQAVLLSFPMAGFMPGEISVLEQHRQQLARTEAPRRTPENGSVRLANDLGREVIGPVRLT